MQNDDRALMSFLRPMVNEKRLTLLDKMLEKRTRYITVVLEDIYQPHNASAVLRTCDSLGIQDVHVIENRNKYTINPDVELGSAQWLSINKYNKNENNTEEAVMTLKEQGYRIVATTPHTDEVTLPDFSLEKGKAAIMLGTEMKGLSPRAIELADEYLKIPMHGFVESYNISVSAAIILYTLRIILDDSMIYWNLDAEEKEDVYFQWIKNSVKNSKIIERDFKRRYLK